MKNKTARILPKLIALPIPQFEPIYSFGIKKKAPSPSKLKQVQDPAHLDISENQHWVPSILESIDALQSVISLTHEFLSDLPADIPEPGEWLKGLASAINALEESISRGKFNDDQHPTIETDGTCDIDVALCEIPDFESCFEEKLDLLTINLLCFWFNEINRRGWELFYICIRSVDCQTAEQNFKLIKSLLYPTYSLHKEGEIWPFTKHSSK